MNATDDLSTVSSGDINESFTVDNVDPHHWRDFTPTDLVDDQTPNCMIEVNDITAGLDVSAACYKYSIDGGSAEGARFLRALQEATAQHRIRR